MKRLFASVMLFVIIFSSFAVMAPKVQATPAPVISSVSAITATNLQTITISGSGFGNTQPVEVPAWDSDGSVDTVVTGTTPVLCISNGGIAPDAWAAGVQNASEGVHCAIGLYINSWTDTVIILGGFGFALNTNGQGPWNIATGDPLDVFVWTPSGETHYKITVGPVPPTTHSVFFDESGIGNPAQVWSVTLDGYGTEYSNGPGNTIYTIMFAGVANGGPYYFTVAPPSGFLAQPGSGTIMVSGGDFHQPIAFNSVPVTYTFTLTAGSGGSISYSYSGGSGTVSSGQSQTLTVPQNCQFSLAATPDSTYVFQSWSPTGSVSILNPSSASTTAMVNGNSGVTANFAHESTVTLTSGTGGSVSYFSPYASGTLSGGQSISLQVPQGSLISLTANPESQRHFNGWSTHGSVSVSSAGSASATLTVNGDGGVTANFVVSAGDFALKVSPQEQTVPIAERAVFSVQVVPINGFSDSVTLSTPNLPTGIVTESPFSPGAIQPSQTSTLVLGVNQLAQAGGLYSIDVLGTSGQLVHDETVKLHVTKTVGLMNLIDFDSKNVSHTIGNPLAGCTIQQNFVVFVPSTNGGVHTYWAQNVIFIENAAGGDRMAAAFQIFDYPNFNIAFPNPRDCNPNPPGLIYGIIQTGPLFSLYHIYNFTSLLSGNELMFSNDCGSWSWQIPTEDGQQPDKAFIWNGIGSALEFNSPEFLVVGPPDSGKADFLYQTDGSVHSLAKLMDQPWTRSVVQTIASSSHNKPLTGETSSGLHWDVIGVGAGNGPATSFSWKSGSDMEGIFYMPVGSSALESGATMEDQTYLTGVSVGIVGSSGSDGTPVTITTASLTGAPRGIVEVSVTPAAYYDVNVTGISDGMATVCITNSGVTGQTTMQYWTGVQWVGATDVSVSGDIICGNIPVSALTGTIIAVGPIQPHDVGVIDVTPSRNWTYQGRSTNISVTTANFGAFTENLTLNLFYTGIEGDGTVGSEMVVLAPNETETQTFTWNTTGVPFCYSGYNITAVADIFPETDNNLTNNSLLSPSTVEIRLPCDVNGDAKVDITDVAIAAQAFGSNPSRPRWNPDKDLNVDGRVDITDIALIAKHFGEHFP